MKKLALLLVCFIAVLASQAQDYTWNGSTSSDWGTANNWDPVGIPGENDNVLINLAADNQPTITGNVTIKNFKITDGNLQIGNGASLTITGTASQESNGTVFLVSGSSLLCTNENYAITGGFLNDPNGATFQITGAGKKLDHQGGTVNIAGALTTENLSHSGGTMTFQSSSVVTINNSFEIASGGVLTCNGTLTGNGQLSIYGTLNITGSGAGLVIHGITGLSGGSITLNEGSAEFNNSLTIQNSSSITIENNGNMDISGNLTVYSGSSFTVDQGTLNTGDLEIKDMGSTFNHLAGQVTVGAAPVK